MISEFVRIQAEGYVLCLMVGSAMGIVGVVFGGLRKLLRSGKIVTWFCDLALWLVLSVAIIALINWVASKMADYILYRKSKD